MESLWPLFPAAIELYVLVSGERVREASWEPEEGQRAFSDAWFMVSASEADTRVSSDRLRVSAARQSI